MNLPVKFAILLLPSLALANDTEEIYGKYVTVSEAECIQIIEMQNDYAVFSESCEPDPELLYGAHNSFPTQWTRIGDEITIKMPNESVKFKLTETLSCAKIGKSGVSAALVGYGTVFWKIPFTCK